MKMDKKEFRGEYRYSNNFKIEYANGILGNITGMGKDIIINFYFEKPQYPTKFTLHTQEEGILNEIYEGITLDVVREVLGGVVLNIDTAKSLYEWLGRNIEEAERMKKEEGV